MSVILRCVYVSALATMTMAMSCWWLSDDPRVTDTVGKIGEGVLEKAVGERQPGVDQPPTQILVMPASLEFGTATVGSESFRAVVVLNPTGIALTVLKATFDRDCFGLRTSSALPVQLPAQSQVSLDVVFRPVTPGVCSGVMELEVDSAGGRFQEVPVRGNGTVMDAPGISPTQGQ